MSTYASVSQAANSSYRFSFKKSSLISKPKPFYSIDLMKDKEIRMDRSATFDISKKSELHGFCGYFIATLCDGVKLDASPSRITHWRQEFFPLYEPVALEKGSLVKIRIKAILHKAFVDWRWEIYVNGRFLESHSTINGIRLKEQKPESNF